MTEQKYLLGCIKSKEVYSALLRVGYNEHLSDLGRIIFNLLETYYSNDSEAVCVDITIFTDMIVRKYPKHEETILQVLQSAPGEELSIPNLLANITEARRHQLQTALGEACWKHSSQEIEPLINQLQELERFRNEAEEQKTLIHRAAVSDIINSVDDSNRIRIYPLKINTLVGGGALPGHHIVVFGVPDAGKTTFTINMVRGFLKDGHKVLYIANEEPARVMLQRVIQSILGITSTQFLNSEFDLQDLESLGYSNFYLYHNEDTSIKDIDDFASEVKPNVIVVDQIKNMSGGSKDGNLVLDLESVAKKVRKLGLKHNATTVSVTQAADSAANKVVLEQGDVYYSNTGIPGAADLMIGLGMNRTMFDEGRRMVSFPKCKLTDKPVAPILVDMNLSIARVR